MSQVNLQSLQPVTQIYGLSPAPIVVTRSQPPSPRRSPRASPAPLPVMTPLTTTIPAVVTPVQVTPLPVVAVSPVQTTPAQVPSLLFKNTLTPMTTQSYNDYGSMITEASVEQRLLKAGFTPVERIVIRDDDGTHSAKYIKAITRTGQTALVELDQTGYVATTPADLNVIQSKEATAIPYSTKIGTIESVGQEIAGVAFLCEDNVCVVSRTEEPVPEETFYVSVHKSDEKTGHLLPTASLDTTPIVHPVVRLSEVVASPEAVTKSIEEAASSLRRHTYNTATNDLKQTRECAGNLESTIGKFETVQKNAAKRVSDSIQELKKLLEGYSSLAVIEANKDKFMKILQNLRIRNERLIELLLAIESVARKKHKLARIQKEIESKIEFINAEYQHLDHDLSI